LENSKGVSVMINLSRILVPSDFSENARNALKYAAALAERFSSEIHLMHVVQDVTASLVPEPGFAFAPPDNFMQELRDDATRNLQSLAKSDILEGRKVVTLIRQGSPFVEIVRYAREELIDLIVISTHGRTGLAHVFLGSVAEQVVRKAGCPVLTVRPKGHQFIMP
jgi:nucleotide-binding universal stress UspA family protein